MEIRSQLLFRDVRLEVCQVSLFGVRLILGVRLWAWVVVKKSVGGWWRIEVLGVAFSGGKRSHCSMTRLPHLMTGTRTTIFRMLILLLQTILSYAAPILALRSCPATSGRVHPGLPRGWECGVLLTCLHQGLWKCGNRQRQQRVDCGAAILLSLTSADSVKGGL